MITIDEALELVFDGLAPLGPERVPLADAEGRVAAEPALSAVDLPPFDRSAMDGYAVRAADTAPGVPLRLVGGVAAGEVAAAVLEPGTATRDLDRRRDPGGRGRDPAVRAGGRARRPRRARARARPGTQVRYRGEDLRAGTVLAPTGAVFTLPRISGARLRRGWRGRPRIVARDCS